MAGMKVGRPRYGIYQEGCHLSGRAFVVEYEVERKGTKVILSCALISREGY